MYVHIYEDEFIEQFERHGRKDQFSRAALKALFDFYTMAEDELGESFIDIIAICCEWTEYKSETEARAAYADDELFNNLIKLETQDGGVVIYE